MTERSGASLVPRGIALGALLLGLALVPTAYASLGHLAEAVGLTTTPSTSHAGTAEPSLPSGAAANLDADDAALFEAPSEPASRAPVAHSPPVLGKILPEAHAATPPVMPARSSIGRAESGDETVWLFVQRSGVNIRSAPGRSGRVIATADKGMLFKVIGRSGSWRHVETAGGPGWISAPLLGSTPPQLADNPM